MSVGEHQCFYYEDPDFQLELNMLRKRREIIQLLDALLGYSNHDSDEVESPPASALPTPMWASTDYLTGYESSSYVETWLAQAQEAAVFNRHCCTTVQDFFKHFNNDIIYPIKNCRSEYYVK